MFFLFYLYNDSNTLALRFAWILTQRQCINKVVSEAFLKAVSVFER